MQEANDDVILVEEDIGYHTVGDSPTLLYINEGLIRLAKVSVIACGHLTGLLLCGF